MAQPGHYVVVHSCRIGREIDIEQILKGFQCCTERLGFNSEGSEDPFHDFNQDGDMKRLAL